MPQHAPLANEAMPCFLWLFDLAVGTDSLGVLMLSPFQEVEEFIRGLGLGKLSILGLYVDGVDEGQEGDDSEEGDDAGGDCVAGAAERTQSKIASD